MSRTIKLAPFVFRRIRHRQVMAEFHASKVDPHTPGVRVPCEEIRAGRWADITPAGWACKNTPAKVTEAKRRRKAARVKRRLQHRGLRSWGGDR